MPKSEAASPLRAALYIRVSTEEQALRGYSLEAQHVCFVVLSDF